MTYLKQISIDIYVTITPPSTSQGQRRKQARRSYKVLVPKRCYFLQVFTHPFTI